MVKPLYKIRQIRSFGEIVTRGGQAVSVLREKRKTSALPTDEEFVDVVDQTYFGSTPIIAETLWKNFYKNSDERFFQSFRRPVDAITTFRQTFGEEVAEHHIARAAKIVNGEIDLLGFENVSIGTTVDWHLEPISGKKSPLKHWKEFDDLDTTETGNKKIIWELNRHQHFFTLGLAFWLTGNERYAEVFAQHLDSWIDENPPGMGINWASSLEIGFRAISWIWAFQFFRNSDHFTPELFKKGLKSLYSQGRHIERYLSTYYSPNTHLTGEALALYYLGTQLPFITDAANWRKTGEDILLGEITKQVLEDGVYFEQSTWYQRYTADLYLQFIVLRSLSAEHDLSRSAADLESRLSSACDLMMSLTMPDGTTPLIGDDDGGRVLPLTADRPDDFRGSLSTAAVLFGRGDLRQVAEKAGEELFWLLGTSSVAAFRNIPESEPEFTSASFDDGGCYVLREGWSSTDSVMVVDCGPVGALSGGHGHADTLSLTLALHGKPLFVDPGTFTYHDTRQDRDLFRSTASHNTLEVDGRSSSETGGAFSWKSRANASKETWISHDRFDLFEGSHDGYHRLSDPVTHSRSILGLRGDYWIVRDVVKAAGDHSYSLSFHYHDSRKPEVHADVRSAGDQDHRVVTFGDNGKFVIEEGWVSRNHGARSNAPVLRYRSQGVGTQEFFTFILPANKWSAAPEVTEVPINGGRGFEIRNTGSTDLFVFNDSPGQMIDVGTFATDFEYSWARVFDGQNVPDEFVVAKGNRLNLAGHEILRSHEANHASIRRLGNDLYIKTDLGIAKRSLIS